MLIRRKKLSFFFTWREKCGILWSNIAGVGGEEHAYAQGIRGFGPQKPSFDGRSGILLVRLLYLFWLSGFIYAEPRLQQCAVCSGAGADCSSDADCAAADRVFDRYVYHLQKVFTYNDGSCHSSSVFIPGFDGQSGFVLWGGCSSGDPVLSVAFFD